MTDFRALCAELLDALENAIGVIYCEGGTKHISTADAVITKADAALAQPEPQGPTVMQILALSDEIEAEELGTIDLVRRALARWGRPAIEPLP
jgi:hypothetical protein